MIVKLSKYSGFCDGVRRSLMLLDGALEKSCPIFLSGEIVHNTLVSKKYEKLGVKYIDECFYNKSDMCNLPNKSKIVIAAHGIPENKRQGLIKNNIEIVDTTCPVVEKRRESIKGDIVNHKIVVLFIKTKEHSEVKTLTDDFTLKDLYTIQTDSDLETFINKHKSTADEIIVHTQTTFPFVKTNDYVNRLKEHFSSVILSSSICPNCYKRQEDVVKNSKMVDAVIVVGSSHSSNANELVKIAKENGCTSYLVESENNIPSDIAKCKSVFVISSASSSDDTFNKIVAKLNQM